VYYRNLYEVLKALCKESMKKGVNIFWNNEGNWGDVGCGNSGCQVFKTEGMHTDGGCKCHKNSEIARSAILNLLNKIAILERKEKLKVCDINRCQNCIEMSPEYHAECIGCDGVRIERLEKVINKEEKEL